MKTVCNYLIAMLITMTLFFAVMRGAGFTMCNVEAYGIKSDKISLVFSSDTAKASALTCEKEKKPAKHRR
ncbi:hypothetical protein CG435_23305 [Pantoea ananatis]|uniref:hypothetical protein n=1 Tax=Pantoea ananas TaxID=553 RepID=UPI000CF44095|nr:hypothetical protein [Pantoea ananatis]PQK94683.1 hypothetical protein CG435_23305 [Pantoea ananatis]